VAEDMGLLLRRGIVPAYFMWSMQGDTSFSIAS
jgi:hypothetical protein